MKFDFQCENLFGRLILEAACEQALIMEQVYLVQLNAIVRATESPTMYLSKSYIEILNAQNYMIEGKQMEILCTIIVNPAQNSANFCLQTARELLWLKMILELH